VARILVCDPHPEVRALLGHVVSRLGHEPVYLADRPGEALPGDVDVILLEPADPRALGAAQVLRLRYEHLPIVCASIYPETANSRRLGPVAYLVKPFPLGELERALTTAVERLSLPV
jgi:CheY-like chemotaxis protein